MLDKNGGANFFMGSHAVKVEAAADTFIIWKPTAWHGTSLLHQDPNDTMMFQAGPVILNPLGVARLWANVQEKNISLEEARKKILELESEESDC